jgi:hypothetical protein
VNDLRGLAWRRRGHFSAFRQRLFGGDETVTKVLGRIGLVVVLVALTSAGAAFAGNTPSECTYHPEKCKTVVQGVKVVKGVTSTPAPKVTVAGSTGLPFTGTDVTLLLVGGAVFGLVGFGMRRSGRDRNDS